MWRRAIRVHLVLMLAVLASGLSEAMAQVQRCGDKTGGIGVSRIVEIDALAGPHFGQHTRNPKEPSFLQPKEVVLTFDDGPMPGLTRSILDTLDEFCTRATFFAVGRMAAAYPWLVRETMARGHTVGTHTWSHPLNLRKLRQETSTAEIERGFSAVALAAGQPIAPFFRFPGLNDSPAMLTYLQGRSIATFTVDVISDDSYIQSTERLIQTTLQRVEAQKGGILLFHDIKQQTAKALPRILSELRLRGYTVVHMRSRRPFEPKDDVTAALKSAVTIAAEPGAPRKVAALDLGALPISRVTPEARDYAGAADKAPGDALVRRTASKTKRPQQASLQPPGRPIAPGGWATTLRRVDRDRAPQYRY